MQKRVAVVLLALAACNTGKGPATGPGGTSVCEDLPLRDEAMSRLNDALHAIDGVGLETVLEDGIPLDAVARGQGYSFDEGARLIRDQDELAQDEALAVFRDIPFDWENEALAIVREAEPPDQYRYRVEGEALEIHVGRPVPCTEAGEFMGAAVGQGYPRLRAFRVPRVGRIDLVIHEATFRFPRFESVACRRDATHPVVEFAGWMPLVLPSDDGFSMWYMDLQHRPSFASSRDGVSWDESAVVRLEFERGEPSSYRPAIVRRPVGYRMYFSDWLETGIVASDSFDGIHWTAPTEVYRPAPDSWDSGREIQSVAVAEHDGRAWLLYVVADPVFPGSRLGLLVSDDGEDWRPGASGPVLEPGLGGSFDDQAVGAPTLALHEGKLVVWYVGSYGSLGWRAPRSVLATATSVDGVHWTKADHPAFAPPVYPYGLWDPSVVVEPGGYRVWFSEWTNHPGTIGQAFCSW